MTAAAAAEAVTHEHSELHEKPLDALCVRGQLSEPAQSKMHTSNHGSPAAQPARRRRPASAAGLASPFAPPDVVQRVK